MTPNNVEQLRERHGLTRAELAKLCWRSRQTIYRWEQGAEVDPARFELAGLKLGDELAKQQVRDWADREGEK